MAITLAPYRRLSVNDTLTIFYSNVHAKAEIERAEGTKPLSKDRMIEILEKFSYKSGTLFSFGDKGSERFPHLVVEISIPVSGNSITGSKNAIDRLCGDCEVTGVTSEAEFLLRVRSLIHSLEIHEADEWFKVNGETLYNPHSGKVKPIQAYYGTIIG
jgi:hypothetical protein